MNIDPGTLYFPLKNILAYAQCKVHRVVEEELYEGYKASHITYFHLLDLRNVSPNFVIPFCYVVHMVIITTIATFSYFKYPYNVSVICYLIIIMIYIINIMSVLPKGRSLTASTGT